MSSEDLQFRIIEPPLLPKTPSGPKRLLFYTAVLVIGFGAGIGVAFLVSQLNPVLIRPKQLLNLTDFPIWGTVTHLNIEQINKTNRTRLLVFVLSSGVIFAMYAVLMAAEIMNVDIFRGML